MQLHVLAGQPGGLLEEALGTLEVGGERYLRLEGTLEF